MRLRAAGEPSRVTCASHARDSVPKSSTHPDGAHEDRGSSPPVDARCARAAAPSGLRGATRLAALAMPLSRSFSRPTRKTDAMTLPSRSYAMVTWRSTAPPRLIWAALPILPGWRGDVVDRLPQGLHPHVSQGLHHPRVQERVRVLEGQPRHQLQGCGEYVTTASGAAARARGRGAPAPRRRAGRERRGRGRRCAMPRRTCRAESLRARGPSRPVRRGGGRSVGWWWSGFAER